MLCLFEMKRIFCLQSFNETFQTHSLLFIEMKLSFFRIVVPSFRRGTSFNMYLISRTASFARLFILLCFCGLVMYVVLAFYTFHVAFTSVTRAERTQQKLKNYPEPSVGKESDSDLKYILLWSIPDFKINLSIAEQRVFIDNDCDYVNCYLTTNKTFLSADVTNFDAIVFSISTLRRWQKYLPSKRSGKQKYVFYSMIPANNNPVCHVMADNFFNWTWSYKLYSDIFTPFIEVRNLKGDLVAPDMDVEWPVDLVRTFNITKSKKLKALMWYNENCNNAHAKAYAKELKSRMKEHSLEFDIYGCEYKACPKRSCLKDIEKNYSFYLAFEDSVSDDYVTNEVLKGFNNNVVPIVVGGADYTKFLPTDSYIDASYETPERLAGFLEYIIRNPASYSKYFNWKNYYTIREADLRKGYCQLCALLNNKKRTEHHSAYEAFRKWWYYENLHEKCYPKGAESFDAVLSYIDNAELRKSYMP